MKLVGRDRYFFSGWNMETMKRWDLDQKKLIDLLFWKCVVWAIWLLFSFVGNWVIVRTKVVGTEMFWKRCRVSSVNKCTAPSSVALMTGLRDMKPHARVLREYCSGESYEWIFVSSGFVIMNDVVLFIYRLQASYESRSSSEEEGRGFECGWCFNWRSWRFSWVRKVVECEKKIA